MLSILSTVIGPIAFAEQVARCVLLLSPDDDCRIRIHCDTGKHVASLHVIQSHVGLTAGDRCRGRIGSALRARPQG